MTLDKILSSLFPKGHSVIQKDGILLGSGTMTDGIIITVIGVMERTALGVDEALALAGFVLDGLKRGETRPLLVLIDSDSQRMSKRDELLGLNEFLAHLAKTLIVADQRGIQTIGLLYGHSAAGAFIATALSTRHLLALPGASPAVMDLPSMAKVTKLSVEFLTEKARSTPVFAPGLDNLAQMGGVLAVLDEHKPLDMQVASVLVSPRDDRDDRDDRDTRDELGASRSGRLKAADIARRVQDLALGSV